MNGLQRIGIDRISVSRRLVAAVRRARGGWRRKRDASLAVSLSSVSKEPNRRLM